MKHLAKTILLMLSVANVFLTAIVVSVKYPKLIILSITLHIACKVIGITVKLCFQLIKWIALIVLTALFLSML